MKFRDYDDNTKGGTWDKFDKLPKAKLNKVLDISIELDDESDFEDDEYPSDDLQINSGPSNLKKFSSPPYGFWGPPQSYTSGRVPVMEIKRFKDF